MKKHWKKIVVLSCLVLVCLIACKEVAFADVGNSFSGGSGGSSGGSYSGGYSGGYGGGSFFAFLPISSPIGMIIILLVVLMFVRQSRNRPAGRQLHGVTPYSSPGFDSNQGIDEQSVVARIQENDPNFSGEMFKTYVKEVYLNVQEAWEQKNWSLIRPFESNTLFNVHNRQLQEYIDMKQTNYMNKQNIRECLIAGYRIDGEYEVVTVKLDASLLDYVLDDETGNLIEGSKTQYQYRSYRLEFVRKKGVLTTSNDTISTTNCPNCGAPTEVTSSGQCEFCRSVITNGDYGWVLNQYRKW